MKRLVLVRHAKAETGGYDHDFSRALSERGMEDAPEVARELKKQGVEPDYILSSPAKRALTTARLFAEEMNFPKEKIVERKGLYHDYTTNDFIEMIQEVPDTAENLFVFGHNPFMYYLAQSMSIGFAGDMPTCSTVVIELPINNWAEAEARKGKVVLHLYPGLLSR
jgi:phosphohistidine phosphatase